MSAISRIDGRGRERVGAAREVLLDDVVLRRALERRGVDAVLLGGDDVEREQPGRRRVDRHRRVHPVERDAVEQRVHVALVRDGHADLADLAARELVVGVVAGLRRQVEGDREAGLPLGEVAAVELVGLRGGRVAGVGPHHPGPVAARAGGGSCGGFSRIGYDSAPCERSTRGTWATRTSSAAGSVDGVLVDPGPESTEDDAAGGARRTQEPRAILLTHIHFDHAGATGALVRRWPDLPVYVHERGARTWPRPSGWSPAPRGCTAGEDGLRRLWGEVLPVPEPTCTCSAAARPCSATSASSTRPGTPPTTSLTCTSRAAPRSSATWPACGSRPSSYVIAPTPPPDIDVEAWDASIDAGRGLGARSARR